MSKTVVINSLDKQYSIEDIRGIKSIQILMEHIQGLVDDILKDVKDFNEIEFFSLKINSSFNILDSDLDIEYKALETDQQYNARLANELDRKERQIKALEKEAANLGYTLIKNNEEK